MMAFWQWKNFESRRTFGEVTVALRIFTETLNTLLQWLRLSSAVWSQSTSSRKARLWECCVRRLVARLLAFTGTEMTTSSSTSYVVYLSISARLRQPCITYFHYPQRPSPNTMHAVLLSFARWHRHRVFNSLRLH